MAPGLSQYQNHGRPLVSSGRKGDILWGKLLCLRDIASFVSSPHPRLELQTIWHTLILPELTAEENLQAPTGATAGAVLCPHLQSCVPLGVLAAPTALTMRPLLAHHGRGKARGSSWPHTQHSTDVRHLQQSAPSLLCSYDHSFSAPISTPDATTTYQDYLPFTPCPAWLQCPSSKAQLQDTMSCH